MTALNNDPPNSAFSSTVSSSAAASVKENGDLEALESEKRTVEASPDDGPSVEVTLLPEEHPQHLSKFRRWVIVFVVSWGALCVACASSTASFTEAGLARDFHVSHIVTILSISLFVQGLGWGPLLVGPLSEVYGRNIVYRISYGLFFVCTFPVAFAPNMAVFLIFRFLSGFAGSAVFTIAGGTVSDLFKNAEVATPMAFYTIHPLIGPAFGPILSGILNQHLYWRWTYRLSIIWSFVLWVCLWVFVPETYVPVLLKWKAERLQKAGIKGFHAPLNNGSKHLGRAILISCYRPFQLLFFDPMASLLDLWTAFILGILYLAFQVFPIIFIGTHHFTVQSAGLSFLGIAIGMVIALFTQPWWNRFYARKSIEFNGRIPIEEQLVPGKVGGILVPISLYWLAFTTYRKVHWIVPIIASTPFGIGIFYVFTAVLTYLVVAYRPIAASAMAANTALRLTFGAVFPLFSETMYHRLGTVKATVVLACLATLMAPLPFIFHKYGPRLRARSRFASREGIE